MTSSPELPARIAKLDDVSKRDQRLYDSDAGEGYKLTYIGQALANYRRLAAENPALEVPPPRKVVRFNRDGWAQLLAVAEPNARAYFLRAAATGTIKVEA